MNTDTGIGGAPMRATTFPDTSEGRKQRPVASGVLDYFPDALVAIAEVSWRGNEQHNPGKPLHWDRSKSGDEADCVVRHFLQRGTRDTDGLRHTAKMAWRALALLQKEIEADKATVSRMEALAYEVMRENIQGPTGAKGIPGCGCTPGVCGCDICSPAPSVHDKLAD